MKRWLRQLRAAVSLGGFWGVAAAVVAGLSTTVLQLLAGGLAAGPIIQSVVQFGLAGWLVGTAFAATLIDFEARGLLGRMRPWRIGVWGALMGGVLVPSVVFLASGSGAIQGLAGLAAAGLGALVGSSLSWTTHRLAESVSRELEGGSASRHLGEAEA